MKVFISWSGVPSNIIAKELKSLIGYFFPYITGWVSNTDISKGTYWPDDLIEQLKDSNYAILCLTQENIVNPWILFEAGFCTKIFEKSYICPYLLDVTQDKLISSPLALFQSANADHDGTLQLLIAINEAYCRLYPNQGVIQPFSNDWIKKNFEVHWRKYWNNMHKQLLKLKPMPNSKEDLTVAKLDALIKISEELRNGLVPVQQQLIDILQKKSRD
jgi:hypothetical protein